MRRANFNKLAFRGFPAQAIDKEDFIAVAGANFETTLPLNLGIAFPGSYVIF